MPLFRRISLPEIDPLGGGLREEILAEQAEADAFGPLEGGVDSSALMQFWESVESDFRNNPDHFSFSEGE